MSQKYKGKNLNAPIGDQKLEIAKGFDEYPNWAIFKGEDGKDYILPFDKVEEIKDDNEES